MAILSIDLASRRYSDFGIAQIEPGSAQPTFPTPKSIGLSGKPDAAGCAGVIAAYAEANTISVILLDGPQGWRHPNSPIEHMRLAERVLNTPGKTGTPGTVKPKTYLKYITFSIHVFTALRLEYRWTLLEEGWPRRRGKRWLIESFPSAAWSLLGLERLPGKARSDARALRRFTRHLPGITGYQLPKDLSHDQLQAAVVLPVGEAIARRDPNSVILAGFDPLPAPDGSVYEGWIANPRLPER